MVLRFILSLIASFCLQIACRNARIDVNKNRIGVNKFITLCRVIVCAISIIIDVLASFCLPMVSSEVVNVNMLLLTSRYKSAAAQYNRY